MKNTGTGRKTRRHYKSPVTHVFLSIIYSSFFPSYYGGDTMAPGQSITGNQTLTSSGEIFELGFFTPSNSNNSYIGIWYNKISPKTVVWIANRDNPLGDSSNGALKFGRDGNLNLVDEKTGEIYWSTSVPSVGESEANKSVVVISDSGNLILRRTDITQITETHVWQSFDYPCDVLLPGMKVGLNLKTGKNLSLISWRSTDDPSSGTSVLGIDGVNLDQIVIRQKDGLHWRSGSWNGEGFDGLPEMKRTNTGNYSFVRDGDWIYFSYFIYNKSVLSRMVIDVTGQFQQWLGNGQGWNSLWLQPRDLCEIYGACGEFSVCTQDQNLLPSCTCLTGFQPKSQKGLVVNNWNFGGCERKIALRCGKEGFLLVSRMKLPDNSRLMAVSSSEECKAECLSNCSCIAYAFPNPDRCLVWGGHLIDLRETVDGGHDLYLRLNQELNASKKGFTAHKMMLIIIPIVGIIALVIGIILFWRWKAKKDGKKKRSQEPSSFEFGSTMLRTNNSADVHNVGQVKMNGPELPLLSFNSVAAATQDFSLANKLGEGGFGPVYKGKLPNGQEIAVKRLSRSSHQGLEEFKNEIVLIAKLQHRNLVRVLGCCIQGEEKILIYEYMPNKSLDSFLFDPTKGALLDWAKRFHIIEGIAQGLLYLHKYSRLRIIHRDLKASNILLDGEMNPRISDFGLARIFGGNETQANTLRVVGTYGYMSPEYALNGRFSVKSDVFSFGVLLLEIISGKKNTGFYQSDQSLNLLGYAWKLWNEGRGLQLLDPSMGDSYITSKVLRCIHVGLLCVQEEVGDRPTMSAIVLMLSNDTTTLPIPKQPNFSLVKIANGMESSSSKQTCSANEMTITMTEGR